MKRTKSHSCRICGKTPLTKNETGLTKKLLNPEAREFFCMECLADYLEVTLEELNDKIEDFKQEGCKLFS